MRHGGQILVDQLVAQGVQRVFSVPGESFLAALDGLHDSGIQNIVCRQEGGAAMMAEAHGKLTGTPGVLFVTRGPGATNASAGIHIAKQDSTPMVVFVGQIARHHRDREAFQEVDYRAVFGTLAKWATEVDQIERLPEYISHAFHLATSGRPGPVVLALPEDMLSACADVADLPAPSPQPFGISDAQLAAVTDALAQAKRPMVLAGGPNWSAKAAADLEAFAKGWNLPVAVSFRRQDRMNNDHPNFVGDLGVGMNPKLGQMLTQADTLLVLGARLGDTTTNGYELLDPTRPGPRILHIHPDPSELGRVYHPALAIPARADQMLARLAQTIGQGAWADWTQTARGQYEAWQTPVETPGAVKLEQVVTWLAANLAPDSILTNGAGNYAAFLHRYYRFRRFGTQVAPTSGSMGYGFPAAIAASLQHPDRTVVCMAGDGCFQMTCNEASTAMQHGAKPIVIVANNGRYGTIRMHQERHYPGRPSGTDLANPDFAALARAYGGHGETVTDQADFPAAFARAQAAGTLAIIELKLDPDMLTTGQSLSQLRAASTKL
ncbi:thiamine pyrophosphate-binding protein [Pseudorhodobacter sp. E13]|uniref:thiamine pyrophosphate-binding protein n=1 Tax=Pseudorhodobacter sp. E13 TaxID=2487931 RepID=UPI000F8D8905|nr:thiamine pyrophosphate-binding protein [Pseudorhodobacter sp. E13]RUS61038.1 thiamine pyrophosphate-binding protein [Pseudorhodobacter sp. E13]